MTQFNTMLIIFVLVLILDSCGYLAADKGLQETHCPLWHVRRKGRCECGADLGQIVQCKETSTYISVDVGMCLTWDNQTERAVINRCPLFADVWCSQSGLQIPANVSGAKLNHITCDKHNRQGTHCKQCMNGYGPAPFSDGFSCADCSQYRHLWLLNLLLQLTVVTFMYLVIIMFQIKGTSSPLNVIITYSQLCVCPILISATVHRRIICLFGSTVHTVILSIIGISNLDFFRFVIPPMCISTSLKFIDILLFEYIIAFYPIVLTLFIFIGIELHDRNCWIAVYLTVPVKKFFNLFKRNWNPKTTILNTCVTFILLAYSKLLFTSVNLLFAVRSYNSDGEIVSTVLLYDPAITFFHSQHIPYAVLALSVIVIFVLLSPLLLMLYPTRLFKHCLKCCGFQRWDILQLIADIFQGWYKDGTKGTFDYRALSALYFMIRIGLASLYITVVLYNHYNYMYFLTWRFYLFVGLFHILLGVFFLIAQPYKKKWMNIVDGVIIELIGVLVLLFLFGKSALMISGIIAGALVLVVSCIVSVYNNVHTGHQ